MTFILKAGTTRNHSKPLETSRPTRNLHEPNRVGSYDIYRVDFWLMTLPYDASAQHPTNRRYLISRIWNLLMSDVGLWVVNVIHTSMVHVTNWWELCLCSCFSERLISSQYHTTLQGQTEFFDTWDMYVKSLEFYTIINIRSDTTRSYNPVSNWGIPYFGIRVWP